VSVGQGAQHLFVDVDPDLGPDAWTFNVDRLTPFGTWTPAGSYATTGPKETRKIKLDKGTYRVVILPHAGFGGVTSDPVTLSRERDGATFERRDSRSSAFVDRTG
jgi:hypothetical protein